MGQEAVTKIVVLDHLLPGWQKISSLLVESVQIVPDAIAVHTLKTFTISKLVGRKYSSGYSVSGVRDI